VPTLNQTVSTLRFFFRVTLRRHDIVEHTHFIREPRKLPVVLSPEEVARLLDAAPGLKYKAALSVAYGAGLRAAEVVSLKVSDIDSERMIIRVEQGLRAHRAPGVPARPVFEKGGKFLGKARALRAARPISHVWTSLRRPWLFDK
jgi:integrase